MARYKRHSGIQLVCRLLAEGVIGPQGRPPVGPISGTPPHRLPHAIPTAADDGIVRAKAGDTARFGLIDRSHSPRLARVSFKRHFGALLTHALCAEGETPDWRSPPSVRSGPFAMAGPCARVPGRYAEPRNVKNPVAHLWSWAIGSSTSAAQRSFDMVVCRRKARPFVLITELGLRENGRPSLRGTALGPGPRSMG
jgi:hypothetical protein